MKIGDLVRYKGEVPFAGEAEPGIILRVYDYEFQPSSGAGSKWRKMASVYWFHLARNSPMEHAQALLELVNENR
jgi:hypothetical protein